METRFEVHMGRRRHAVAHLSASTAHEALGLYLRGLGCHKDEIVRMGENSAAWRGAIYRAVPSDGDRLRAS
jgi:hypothetical protein